MSEQPELPCSGGSCTEEAPFYLLKRYGATLLLKKRMGLRKMNKQAELPCSAECTNTTGAWKPPLLVVNSIQQPELACSSGRTDGEAYPVSTQLFVRLAARASEGEQYSAAGASMLWRELHRGSPLLLIEKIWSHLT